MTNPPLPAKGSAFAVPLEDGRFGVCRVIRSRPAQDANDYDSVLVALSSWVGNSVPDSKDPALRPVLRISHHAWGDEPQLHWTLDPIPDDFIPIGTIKPSFRERFTRCETYAGWKAIRVQPLMQWRWDNDRDAVLAEDQRNAENDSKKSRRRQQEREEYLEKVSLAELRNRRFFSSWDEYPAEDAIAASRKILGDTVNKLHNLGPDAIEADQMTILKACIEQFNEIDAEMDHFIETVEREDICEEFEAIVHACGLGEYTDLADRWRKW